MDKKKRKMEYTTIKGRKCERYVGDDNWVVCADQSEGV